MEPLLTFTSHIGGKNATVSLFTDRLEWSKKGLMSTGAKAGLAVMTAGLSYAATGVRGKQETESIPVRSISHISRKNSGFQDKVTISTSAGDVEMRVARAEALQLVDHVNKLINGTHPSLTPSAPIAQPVAPPTQSYQPAAPAPAAPVDDTATKLQQLANLHQQGILTAEEYAAAKAKALGL